MHTLLLTDVFSVWSSQDHTDNIVVPKYKTVTFFSGATEIWANILTLSVRKRDETMGKYLMLWRLDPARIPVDPKERGAGWSVLMEMVK